MPAEVSPDLRQRPFLFFIFIFSFFFWSSPEFGDKIMIIPTKVEPVCDADLFFFWPHTAFLSVHTKQALRENVACQSFQNDIFCFFAASHLYNEIASRLLFAFNWYFIQLAGFRCNKKFVIVVKAIWKAYEAHFQSQFKIKLRTLSASEWAKL